MKKTFILLKLLLAVTVSVVAQNVGIGTSSPDVKLHLRDSVLAIANLLKLQNASPYISFYDNNNNYKSYIWENGIQLQIGTATNAPVSIAPNLTPSAYFLGDGTVGIGTATTNAKLDVNGNINMSGNLRVNNVAGQPNQVLMTNNSGNTFWGDMGEYKNVASFTQNGIWTVPAGVAKIRIEAWGGGGGGAIGGGGAGGVYIRTSELTVVPADNITITIGTGGAGALTSLVSGTDGTATVISGAFGTYTAFGGRGGLLNNGGYPTTITLTGSSFVQIPGMPGMGTVYEYTERTAGQFVEIAKYGSGGGVAPFYITHPGGLEIKDLNTNFIIKTTYPPINTAIRGTGGAGGFTGSAWGENGAGGMVIIHY